MTIKVKPLVWKQGPRNGWKIGVLYTRDYYIIRCGDGWHLKNASGSISGAVFPDSESAKAAAQAAHEARILSAIEAVDTATIRAEALREAHDAIAEYPRVAPDGTEAQHYDEQIEHSQAIILALIDKEQGQ